MKSIFIDNKRAILYTNYFVSKGLTNLYLPKKRKIQFSSPAFSSPISMRLAMNLDYEQETQKLTIQDFKNQVFVMIRSGMACCGFFENGEMVDHKVFRAYMVRKKQGKSQIKYLKTKGKSRAGSRVRLAETLEFFEDINKRLNEYFESYRVDQIAISCATTLIPYLFGSKVTTPFEKNDQRLITIPKHIASPTFEALKETFTFMLKNEMQWDAESDWLLESFDSENNPTMDTDNTSEDW